MAKGLVIKLNRAEFRAIMNGAGVSQLLLYEAQRAKYRAEAVSGLKFGAGVDHRPVSARGWVGAPSLTSGHHRKQAQALSKALHGV